MNLAVSRSSVSHVGKIALDRSATRRVQPNSAKLFWCDLRQNNNRAVTLFIPAVCGISVRHWNCSDEL